MQMQHLLKHVSKLFPSNFQGNLSGSWFSCPDESLISLLVSFPVGSILVLAVFKYFPVVLSAIWPLISWPSEGLLSTQCLESIQPWLIYYVDESSGIPACLSSNSNTINNNDEIGTNVRIDLLRKAMLLGTARIQKIKFQPCTKHIHMKQQLKQPIPISYIQTRIFSASLYHSTSNALIGSEAEVPAMLAFSLAHGVHQVALICMQVFEQGLGFGLVLKKNSPSRRVLAQVKLKFQGNC